MSILELRKLIQHNAKTFSDSNVQFNHVSMLYHAYIQRMFDGRYLTVSYLVWDCIDQKSQLLETSCHYIFVIVQDKHYTQPSQPDIGMMQTKGCREVFIRRVQSSVRQAYAEGASPLYKYCRIVLTQTLFVEIILMML